MDRLLIDDKYNFSIAGLGDLIHFGCVYKGMTEIAGETFIKVIALDSLQERLVNPKHIWGISRISLIRGNHEEDEIQVIEDGDDYDLV